MLVSNLGLAFIAHYNAPAMYESLADRSPQKFAKVVMGSFAVLSLLYLLCMGFGYATFGDKAAANVLNNYAEADTLAVRLAAAAAQPPSPPPLTASLNRASKGARSRRHGVLDPLRLPFGDGRSAQLRRRHVRIAG